MYLSKKRTKIHQNIFNIFVLINPNKKLTMKTKFLNKIID